MALAGSCATSYTNRCDHQDTFLRLAMGNRVLARAKWHVQKGLTEETSIVRLFTEAEQGLRKPAKDHEMTRDLQQREAVNTP